MAKAWAARFYASKQWKACRTAFIAQRIRIDGGVCQTCGKEIGKIVHHKTWLTADNINNPDIALNHRNLKFDCQTCHNREKDGERADVRRYRFDENGNVVPV